MFTKDHLVGFAAGLGVAAVGFYAYKKHQAEVDAFLEGKGIKLPGPSALPNTADLTLEELVSQKERLEDLIAEREVGGSN